MRTAEFIERCLAAGMPVETALAAAKAFEIECAIAVDEALSSVREKARERQAKSRASRQKPDCHVTSVTVETDDLSRDRPEMSRDKRDKTDPLTRVEITPLRIIPLETTTTVTERTRDPNDWPEGSAKDHAAKLVEIAATSRLDPARSPDLATTMGRLHAWKTAGASWEFDVVPAVQKLAAGAKRAITSWKYFDGAVAESVAANREALSIPEAGAITNFPRSTGPPMSITDRIAAENAEVRRRVLEHSSG